MKPICLIADEMHGSILEMLSSAGIEAVYKPEIKPAELLEEIHRYDGLILRSKMFIGRELLERASRLLFIARAGAGLDQLDVAEIEKRNILILNAPEGNRDALAEHTLGMLLSLLHKVVKSDREVRKGIWDREGNRGTELKNKTVALIGYGFMGAAVAARLKCFDCRVLAYDKNPEKINHEFAERVSMERVFNEADIVSLHIPLDSSTRGMVNYQYLSSFRKNIWLVNTSRGEIVVLKDLNQAINEGKVLGAALDVLENEKINSLNSDQKLQFDLLVQSDKVILTPHTAGWSHESYVRINQVLVEKIRSQVMF